MHHTVELAQFSRTQFRHISLAVLDCSYTGAGICWFENTNTKNSENTWSYLKGKGGKVKKLKFARKKVSYHFLFDSQEAEPFKSKILAS